jgi:ABC-2 type transport system ATP-binding protein
MIAVRAAGVHKRYGNTAALVGLDLEIPQGVVYGLLGPNGAGKTTAIRVFATLTRPDRGEVSVAGVDVVRNPQLARARIGLAGQNAAVDEKLTGRENLRMFGRLSRFGERGARLRADELLARFDLRDAADRLVKGYSGGMRRRLDLAASLLVNPPVLFLDEPTTGLDPRARGQIWDDIRELARAGTTVLLTTQYLDEADRLAAGIAVIDAGRVIASGSPDELKRQVAGDRIEVTLTGMSELDAVVAAVRRAAEAEPNLDLSTLKVTAPAADPSAVLARMVRELDARGITAADIGLRRATLDDVFLQLTGHRAIEDSAIEDRRSEDDAARSPIETVGSMR